jgi:hypothetical protein
MTRARFYGYYWYLSECLQGSSVDEYDMERAWEDYQKNPSEFTDDPEWQKAVKRLDRK